jgi:hypothetical protein
MMAGARAAVCWLLVKRAPHGLGPFLCGIATQLVPRVMFVVFKLARPPRPAGGFSLRSWRVAGPAFPTGPLPRPGPALAFSNLKARLMKLSPFSRMEITASGVQPHLVSSTHRPRLPGCLPCYLLN